MVSNEIIEKCRQALLDRKHELIEHLQDHYGLNYELVKESVGELSNYDNHPGDLATELYEREKDIALNEHAEQEMKDINDALAAIEKGSYGKCKVCGVDIPEERLEAIPTALTCVQHAEDGVPYRRPIEEEVTHPDIVQRESEAIEDESTAFDGEDSWQAVARYGTSESPSDFYDQKKDYNNMYINSDELISNSEEVEDIALSDMDGKYDGFNRKHNSEDDNNG